MPVPVNTEALVEALLEGVLLRERGGRSPDQLMFQLDDLQDLVEQRDGVHRQWEAAADREKRSRTMFAQETIKVDEVSRELAEVRAAIGSGLDVKRFVHDALTANHAVVTGDDVIKVELAEAPQALRDAWVSSRPAGSGAVRASVAEGEVYLSRTHPYVEGLAAYVGDTALDALEEAPAKRMGVIRTSAGQKRTTLLLLRLRFHITDALGRTGAMLAEECQLVGFRGAPSAAEWLGAEQVEALLAASPTASIGPDQQRAALESILSDFEQVPPHLEDVARERAQSLAESHDRVRRAVSRSGGVAAKVVPELPVDVLGTMCTCRREVVRHEAPVSCRKPRDGGTIWILGSAVGGKTGG